MKTNRLLLLFLICNLVAQAKDNIPSIAANEQLHFIENKGQITNQYYEPRTDIQYKVSAGHGLNIFLGTGMLHYVWAKPIEQSGHSGPVRRERYALGTASLNDQEAAAAAYELFRMDVTLIGANPQAEVIASQEQSFYERYYTPQFGEQGATAHTYQKVTYRNVYPNIDWVLYVNGSNLEYDFVVRPGGKVSDIQLQYGGTTQLSLNGALTAMTPFGSITEAAPVSYQQADGKAIPSFFILNNNTVSFATGDYSGTLVIDPTLSWSTFYGGSADDQSRNNSLNGDNKGNVYIGGYTQSTANIATVGSYKDTLTSAYDVFLAKFNDAGTRQWATYYGGSGTENLNGVVCDKSGKVYIAGHTNSPGLASTGSYQTVLNITGSGTDAFLAQFDTSGARIWSTYYGGSGGENGFGITCDKDNNVFITGYTASTANIATTGAYQTIRASSSDCFLAKFNSVGALKWATYYGGTGVDRGLALSCDSNKNVYMVGYTQSTSDIATAGAYQTSLAGAQDAFIVKFDSTGNRLWATYYGGTGNDQGLSVACDQANNTYLSGYTFSAASIASTGSHQSTFGGGTNAADAYLVKFNDSGTRLWATYYGNTGDDAGNGIQCDHLGNIYMTGYTNSTTSIATSGAFKDTLDGLRDAFLVKFDTSGVRKWGTYFGGEASEYGYSMFCNALSKVYISGNTNSFTNIATTGSHQTTNNGGTNDIFLTKFDDCQLTAPSSISGQDTVCRNGSYSYSLPVVVGATSYTWTLPTGWTGSSTTNTITVTAGTTSDTIRVSANFACGSSAQAILPIIINPTPTITPSGTLSQCNGDSTTLTASSGISYQWLEGGTVITGATADTCVVHSANTYAVIVTSSNGCVDTSLSDTVIVHPLPMPVITASGNLLSTGSYAGYQWNHDGVPITGANGDTYAMAILTGNYTVTVIDSNGCTATSAPYSPPTSVYEISDISNAVRVYPNPVSGWLSIESIQPVTASITTIEGKAVLIHSPSSKIDLSCYVDGVYLLSIYNKEGVLIGTEKLLKYSSRY